MHDVILQRLDDRGCLLVYDILDHCFYNIQGLTSRMEKYTEKHYE